jgi:hypothetical protein
MELFLTQEEKSQMKQGIGQGEPRMLLGSVGVTQKTPQNRALGGWSLGKREANTGPERTVEKACQI